MLTALVLAGCGGVEPQPDPAPGLLVTETAGRGVQRSTIIRPDVSRPLPVVVFLHGWGAPDPGFYRPWVEHLARRGNAVVYPRYQDSFVQPPRQALGNVLAALRIALARPGLRTDAVVVAGHSAGGALAADYAALARTAGLPAPRAIFAAYPGRRLPRIPDGLPEIPPGRIAAGTRIVAPPGSKSRRRGRRAWPSQAARGAGRGAKGRAGTAPGRAAPSRGQVDRYGGAGGQGRTRA